MTHHPLFFSFACQPSPFKVKSSSIRANIFDEPSLFTTIFLYFHLRMSCAINGESLTVSLILQFNYRVMTQLNSLFQFQLIIHVYPPVPSPQSKLPHH